jgi:general secretion pathway protein G
MSNRTHRNPAFTLLEMMLVVMIMGVLMGIAAWAIIGQAKQARIKSTVATLNTVSAMVKTYNINRGDYPAKLAELVPEYADHPPVDAWKHPLVYAVNPPGAKRPYELYSKGPNGEANAEPIDYWNESAAAAAPANP